MDETFTVIETSQKNELLEHVNSIDKHIQFTAEDQRRDGAMSFLDTLNSTYNEVVFNEMLAIMKQISAYFFYYRQSWLYSDHTKERWKPQHLCI